MTRIMTDPLIKQLHKLARLYGIQLAYYDVEGNCRHASPEALIRVLRTLSAHIHDLQDVPDMLASRRRFLYGRFVEPVVVAWEGVPARLKLRIPHDRAEEPIRCHLVTEDGGVNDFIFTPSHISSRALRKIDGIPYVVTIFTIPVRLPIGYHQLTVEMGRDLFRVMVIASPIKAFGSSSNSFNKQLGVFAPIYALHSKRSWGTGDLTDLEALITKVAEAGVEITATTPILASFLNGVFDPSPYAPASRLFWNELYIDISRVPELAHCSEAQTILGSSDFKRELKALQTSPLVDYRRHATQKRGIMERLAAFFFSERPPSRYEEYLHYLDAHPLAEEYARFQSTCEAQGRPWPEWPSPLREGSLSSHDFERTDMQYHLYAQWVMQEQLASVARKAEDLGHGLCLDMPLGVHRHSFDVWHDQGLYCPEVSAGAPPDPFFSKGQNWCFPPLHPHRLREQCYAYYIASLRTQLEHASLLRIDHVMGLHRLFWIPEGLEADQGVYVHYHADEFYAILSIESHRHDSLIIGENLGTVPFYVNRDMDRHNLLHMYILQFELPDNPHKVIKGAPANALAGLNTHDMPTFTAFWRGLDIDDRVKLGLLDHQGARKEKQRRKRIREFCVRLLRHGTWLNSRGDLPAVLQACLFYLCESPVRIVLVNLEDLWQETLPQNVPGTIEERPNWRRKTRYPLEQIWRKRGVRKLLHDSAAIRKIELKESSSRIHTSS